MLLQLGPIPTDDIHGWTRFARRIVCELRVHPGDLDGVVTDDLLDAWSQLIDTWATATLDDRDQFCWFDDVDNEQAEYLLHGLDSCIQSNQLRSHITNDEDDRHRPTTLAIVQAFVDGLSAEGRCQMHFVDQIKASYGASLDH